MGDRVLGAPGPALDHQAGRCPPRCRVPPRCAGSAARRADACARPRSTARGRSATGRARCRRNSSSAASGTAARLISRCSRQNGRLPAKCRHASRPAPDRRHSRSSCAVGGAGAAASRHDQLVAIGQAERLDLGLDVVDLEHRRLRAAAGGRSCRSGAGARSARPWPAATAPCSPSCASNCIRPSARARTGCDGRAASRPTGSVSLMSDEDALVQRAPPLPRPSVSISAHRRQLASSRLRKRAAMASRLAMPAAARPASCRAPRRNRRWLPLAKIQASRMASPRLAGKRRMAGVERDEIGRVRLRRCRDGPAPSAARRRRVPRRTARGRSSRRRPPARCGRGARAAANIRAGAARRRRRSARWNRSRCRSGRRLRGTAARRRCRRRDWPR